MKSILSILNEIKNDSSTLAKKKILTENKDNEVLKKVLKYTLDPGIVSGYKKLPPPVQSFETYDLDTAINNLDVIYNRQLTGHAGRDYIASVLGSVSEDDAEVLCKILTKELDCGIQAKNANDVFGKNFIKDEPYMRCSLLTEKTILKIQLKKYGFFYCDVKMDGAYLAHIVQNDSVISTSRNGKIHDFNNIKDESFLKLKEQIELVDPIYKDGVVFTGEALSLDMYGNILPRTTSNGIISKAGKGTITDDEASRVIFVIWDAIPLQNYMDGKYSTELCVRRPVLEEAIANSHVEDVLMIEYRKVTSFKEAFEYNSELMLKGEEGSIIKSPDNIWQSHTSPTCLKVKLKMEVDLVCIDVLEGEGKRKNTTGSLTVTSACGTLLSNVGTGFTEEMLDYIWKNKDDVIGSVITVEVNDIVSDKRTLVPSLFLPVFVEIRTDKNEADTYERILEIKESAVEVFSSKMINALK